VIDEAAAKWHFQTLRWRLAPPSRPLLVSRSTNRPPRSPYLAIGPHSPAILRVRVACRAAVPALLLAACATATPVVRGGGVPSPADSATAATLAAERGREAAGRRTVAVPPFRVGSDSSLGPLGFALADFLATDLSRSTRLQLVERSRLVEVMRELALADSGTLDSAVVLRSGRIVQARELLLGALDTLPGGELRLSVRVADVATGLVAQALDARAPVRDVLAAEKALAFRLFEVLGVTLSPAERTLVEERPTSSGEALLAYGRGVQAELTGDPRAAAGEYLRAARLDPSFRLATDRAAGVTRRLGAAAAALIPGVRGVEAPVMGVVDRINRPLDLITTQSRPLPGPGDPAFPTTLVTVVIVIQRP